MTLDHMRAKLDRALTQADTLSRQASELELAPSQVLLETLQELQTALEELQVAEEELRNQTEELEESQLATEVARVRYQTLFDFAPDAYLETDANGIILEANRAAGRLLGVEPHFLPGKPLVNFVPLPERGPFRQTLSAILRDGQLHDRDLRIQDRAGQETDVSATMEAGQNPDAAAEVIRWSLHDVTDRRRLELELRTLNAELEERVRARTADLEASDRAKSEFLAMLGHELRNPLGAATNALHLVRIHGRGVPSLQRPFEVLERQLAQMARLVDDLLDVTRITQSRVKLEMRPVFLDEVVAAALRSLQSRIHEKGLRYRYEGNPEVVVTGDALRLEQVVTNLIGNAVKFTDTGSIHVSVRMKEREAVLRVRDTGIGIAPEALPHVFDLFSQVRTDLARTQGGLGIGLTVVKQMVEQHGGRVDVQSKGLGQGSTFLVTLPLATERPSLSAAESSPMAPGTETSRPSRQGQPLRVLVVDDNTDAAQSLVDILETWGHTTRTVHDGIEAVKAILSAAPDVALIDIGLPGLDGYQVAQAIRQHLGPDGLTLIAVTGYGQAEDRERAIAAGFDHHVAKPINLQALKRLFDAAPPDNT